MYTSLTAELTLASEHQECPLCNDQFSLLYL
jgi:hypothetical protein